MPIASPCRVDRVGDTEDAQVTFTSTVRLRRPLIRSIYGMQFERGCESVTAVSWLGLLSHKTQVSYIDVQTHGIGADAKSLFWPL